MSKARRGPTASIAARPQLIHQIAWLRGGTNTLARGVGAALSPPIRYLGSCRRLGRAAYGGDGEGRSGSCLSGGLGRSRGREAMPGSCMCGRAAAARAHPFCNRPSADLRSSSACISLRSSRLGERSFASRMVWSRAANPLPGRGFSESPAGAGAGDSPCQLQHCFAPRAVIQTGTGGHSAAGSCRLSGAGSFAQQQQPAVASA